MEVVWINLNQPRFVAELLRYLLEFRVEEGSEGILEFSDGVEILKGMGYQFAYQLLS